MIVLEAGDTIVGFQHEDQAWRLIAQLRERLARFGLALHPAKTRLIAFGRFVAKRRRAHGERRPPTFEFCGFTHVCGTTRNRRGFQLQRRTPCRRKWATVKRIGEAVRRLRRAPVDEQGRRMARMLEGYYASFSVPTDHAAARAVRHHVKIRWCQSPGRRSSDGG